MAVPVTSQPVTAAEFLAGEEQHFLQLVGGVVVVNEPTVRHQVIAGRILHALMSWIETRDPRDIAVMPIDVPMGEHDVYAPDVSYYTAARRPTDLDVVVDHLPDLAVEVRSPATWRYNLGRKKGRYEACGLSELWLVDHVAETVLVYRRSTPAAPSFDVALELATPDTLASPLLPGFALTVERLFDVG